MKAMFLTFSAEKHTGKKITWSVMGERNDMVSAILRRITLLRIIGNPQGLSVACGYEHGREPKQFLLAQPIRNTLSHRNTLGVWLHLVGSRSSKNPMHTDTGRI